MHLSQQEVREDIAQLAQTLADSHPDPYSAMGGPLNFRCKMAQLLADVPDEGLTDAQLLPRIRPLVASIRDGHTALGYFSFNEKQVRFWLDWGIVEEQFYVSAVYQSEHQYLIGARLLSLDNISFEELVERMKQIRGYDNQYQNLINLLFSLSDPTFFLELLQYGAEIVGVPSSQAGNCFIDALPFTLKHSGIQGQLSFKWSLLFPNDSLKGKLLRPHRELAYQDLIVHTFDPNTTVLLALERLASR